MKVLLVYIVCFSILISVKGSTFRGLNVESCPEGFEKSGTEDDLCIEKNCNEGDETVETPFCITWLEDRIEIKGELRLEHCQRCIHSLSDVFEMGDNDCPLEFPLRKKSGRRCEKVCPDLPDDCVESSSAPSTTYSFHNARSKTMRGCAQCLKEGCPPGYNWLNSKREVCVQGYCEELENCLAKTSADIITRDDGVVIQKCDVCAEPLTDRFSFFLPNGCPAEFPSKRYNGDCVKSFCQEIPSHCNDIRQGEETFQLVDGSSLTILDCAECLSTSAEADVSCPSDYPILVGENHCKEDCSKTLGDYCIFISSYGQRTTSADGVVLESCKCLLDYSSRLESNGCPPEYPVKVAENHCKLQCHSLPEKCDVVTAATTRYEQFKSSNVIFKLETCAKCDWADTEHF